MKSITKLLTGALLGAAAIAITTTSASAWIVCNREGECWHTHDRYAYHDEFGVVVHPDGWHWRHRDHFTWREHEGRGYWHNGIWITF
jgi:hypothetical protein